MRGADAAGFVERGTSLEPERADLGEERTPLDDFFVCKVGDPVSPDADGWALRLDGDAVNRSVHLTLPELQALPQHRVDAWLECAGNGRGLFGVLGSQPLAREANRTPWMLGAMGMATWEGPSLRTVLELAGLDAAAAWVSPAGLDHPNPEGEPVRMCLPIDKAFHPDTIVALSMNDEPLDLMHGFPARLLVPGWIGAYSVKWLDRIEVSSTWVPSWRADMYYRHRTPEGVDLGPVTSHPVKSSLALPWPAQVAPGRHELRGYARVGDGRVGQVEWRVDHGEWREAELLPPAREWAWQPFTFQWEATAGVHTVSTRATTDRGATQPDEMPFHPNGLLWNAVIPHPVLVVPGGVHVPVTFDRCDHVDGPFFHGTKSKLQPGDSLDPGRESNFQQDRRSNHVYFAGLVETAVWGAELATALGGVDERGHVYVVEPVGPFEDDPNVTNKRFPGNPTQSYRTPHAVRVVGEVEEWEPHPAEVLEAMLANIARLRAEGLDAIDD